MIGHILGHTDKISAHPGDQVAFKVSCDGPASYDASIVRVLYATDEPAGPGLREEPVGTSRSSRIPMSWCRHRRT